MTGVLRTAISCNPFSDDRSFPLCFQVVLFSDNNQTSSWNITTWCLFMACKFRLNRFTMHSHKKRIKYFGQDWRKWLLHLRENDWNTWQVERFCVFIVQSTQKALNDQEYKVLTEQIHCLCINVIYRLSVVTNQSTIDHREQTLHLDTSQLALNQGPTVRQG